MTTAQTTTDGSKIKKAREAIGITQEAASGIFGVSLRTYAGWEATEEMQSYRLLGILQQLKEYQDGK